MKKVRTWLNYNHLAELGELNNMPSMTVPDQTMSIKTLLERNARGLPLEGARVPLYDSDSSKPDYDDPDHIPDPRYLDLAEREELRERYENEISEIEAKKIRHEAWKKAKAAKKAAEQAADKQNNATGSKSVAQGGSVADDAGEAK